MVFIISIGNDRIYGVNLWRKNEELHKRELKKELFIETVKTPLVDEAGNTTGILGIFWDITERKKTDEKIKASLKEKVVLLREIYHRVKNNMQVVISMLRLQSRGITDEKAREAFSDAQKRIHAMSLVHETLYQSDSLSTIDLIPVDFLIVYIYICLMGIKI